MVNLREFVSNLNSVGGVSRPNLFTVEIATPGALNADLNKARQFTLLCEGTNLPGINVGVEDRHLPHGFGIVQKMPWGVTFTDTNFSFYADNSGIVTNLLTNWVDSVVRFNRRDLNDDEAFLVGYRQEYATDIKIRHYDQRLHKISEYTLYDAFPGTIYDQQLNWSETNTANRIVVRMLFTRWTVEHFKLNRNDSLIVAEIQAEVGGILRNLGDGVSANLPDRLQTASQRIVNNIGARFIENVGDAIPLLSGRSLGNLRF